MKPFTKNEIFSIVIIFIILIGVSVPNFIISLRRARDQVRRDDMGALEKALGEYLADYQVFPPSSPDGKIVACNGPCEWGKDGIDKYMRLLPREPNYQKGPSYRYISDGERFQIFVSLEGTDEDEYDLKIVSRNLMCGNVICNAGRHLGCPTDKTIEQCELDSTKK